MKVYETSLRIPAISGNEGLLENLSREVGAHLPPNTLPVRFVVTQSDDTSYHAELGVLEYVKGSVKGRVGDRLNRS